ncbi:hypothetical protein [Pseudomonas sp.]|uniref:hypothetical protein n=1 Tax=Pseudomonas sp. TaxID=306 RepID=UPI0026341609|nr:hypothetical protein [Pseudomonas sp.]
MQPQSAVGGVDGAVAFDGVGDQHATGGDDFFGFALENPPDSRAGQKRHIDNVLHDPVQLDPARLALFDRFCVVVQQLRVAFVVFETPGHGAGS